MSSSPSPVRRPMGLAPVPFLPIAPGAGPPGGTVVAVIDTGLSPELLDDGVVLPGVNLSDEGDPDDTSDPRHHGDLVGATILHIAPRTRLVPIKLMDARGMLRPPSRLESAFDWVVEHRAALGIGIVCAAFADSSHAQSDEAHRNSRLRRQIAALRRVGVATVAAAGNWYPEHRARQSQGMAWPAILREVVSVGAVERRPDGPWLSRTTQRLHAVQGTGCFTTVFAEPGEPGETSGAAATIVGYLAALRPACADPTVDEMVRTLLRHRRTARDESGLAWPAVFAEEVLRGP
jgi:subtilisin family serine protease